MHRGRYHDHQGPSLTDSEYMEQLEDQVTQHQSIIDFQEADLARTKKNYSKTLTANKELRDACDYLKHERNELSRKLVDVTELSNLRADELAGAQAFLTTTDTISGQEVQDRVQILNEEIFQAAAAVGDCVIRRKYDLSDEDRGHYYHRMEEAIGQKTLLMLSEQSDDHPINPLLVQIVVQMFIVALCEQEINSWNANNVEFSDGLTKVYERMQASQQQSVCGRWRALTLAQITTDSKSWTKHVLKNFDRLLALACWEISNPAHFTAFNRHLESIFKAASQVRRGIGQDVISADYKVYLVSNVHFMDTYMEEAYSDNESGENKSKGPRMVVGTTALGLIKLAVSRTNKFGRQSECVVPPKVVVETNIETILALYEKTRSPKNPFSPSHQDSRD